MSRMNKIEWLALYIITGTLDLIELVFPPATVIDPFVGPILFAYFQVRGVSMFSRISRFVSLLGFEILNTVMVSVEPFWILDVWYIHRSVRQEQAEEQAAEEQQKLLFAQNQPLYQDGRRLPPPIDDGSTPPPLNRNGVRYPRK